MTTTDVQLKIETSDGALYHGWGDGFTDTSETEIKVRDLAGTLKSLGDVMPGKTIVEIGVVCTEGSICTTFKIQDDKGSNVAFWRGNERTASDTFYNLHAEGIKIPVKKGYVMKINTNE